MWSKRATEILEKRQARNRSIDVSIDHRVTGVDVFVVGPTAYHMAYHGAEVMVRVLAPSMIAAARNKYDVKTCPQVSF